MTFLITNSTAVLCTDVVNLTDGNYSCEINTTVLNAEAETLTFNASLTNYNHNHTIKYPAFSVETFPGLSNPQIDRLVGGWGETFNLNVTATDEDNDTMTVYFWYKENTTSNNKITTNNEV